VERTYGFLYYGCYQVVFPVPTKRWVFSKDLKVEEFFSHICPTRTLLSLLSANAQSAMPSQTIPVDSDKVGPQAGVENTAGAPRFDTELTENVINATGPGVSLRLRSVIANLTRHLHAFCRESEITRDEFMAAIDMVGSNVRPSLLSC
jgi:hypothetical protein